jgi:hypothetical protein
MVARSVTRQEVTKTLAASQSLKDEAQKLVEKGAWDPSGVREWQQVADTARNTGEKAHVGRVFGIVVEKHPELPHGHPERRFKGRLVFQGNEVRDKNSHDAIFSDFPLALPPWKPPRMSMPTGCSPATPCRRRTRAGLHPGSSWRHQWRGEDLGSPPPRHVA